jgi:predicted TIM-barrel fold metal-dependent hydrolase
MAIHIEADSRAEDAVEETIWLEGVARTHGTPNAIVVMCDITRGGAEAELERHLEASPRVRGIRLREHPADTSSAAFQAGYRALARHGLSYELSASPGRLLAARDLARQAPAVRVLVGHAGSPLGRDDDYLARWRREMAALAELDHVACKVSGFASVDHGWTIESLRPLVLYCIEVFGPDRIVFGTDWPVGSLFSTYVEQVDAFRVIVAEAGFSRDDQARMLAGNARRLYRI